MKKHFYRLIFLYILFCVWLPMLVLIERFQLNQFDFWSIHWSGKLVFIVAVLLSLASTFFLVTQLKDNELE